MNTQAPPSIAVRPALPHELEWVNASYAAIDFLPSSGADLIAIAEVDGTPAGIGRIVAAGDGCGELGGMLVFDAWRGFGLARRIVTFLLAQARFPTLYCLPFAELESFYASAGFARAAGDGKVPPSVAAKHAWCKEHYAKAVLLMQRTAADFGP